MTEISSGSSSASGSSDRRDLIDLNLPYLHSDDPPPIDIDTQHAEMNDQLPRRRFRIYRGLRRRGPNLFKKFVIAPTTEEIRSNSQVQPTRLHETPVNRQHYHPYFLSDNPQSNSQHAVTVVNDEHPPDQPQTDHLTPVNNPSSRINHPHNNDPKTNQEFTPRYYEFLPSHSPQ